MINLYNHQKNFAYRIKEAMKYNKYILAQAQVGYGKTVIAAWMCHRIISKNNTMFFCVHTKDLLVQTCRAFDKFGISYGIIASGYSKRKSNIQICSINTLYRRYKNYERPNLLCIDEAHLSCSKSWSEVINYYKELGSFLVGFSASPHRLSGEGLKMHYDKIIQAESVAWMIKHKYLSEYKMFSPSNIDLSKLKIRMGEYVTSESEKIIDKPSITGDVITHWIKYASGLTTICFCTSIKHSKHVAEQFNNNGIPAIHLDGDCNMQYRKKVIESLANKEIKVITNCQLFTAGFDLSLQTDKNITIESVILLKPTRSLALYIQMTGRALRKKEYPAIILDHAGNVERHGLPDEDREWDLEGNKGNKRNTENLVKVKTCPKCYAVQLSGKPSCSFCEYVFETKERDIAHVEGDLVEVDYDKLKKEKRQKQGMCQTKEELIQEGIRRGYKRPRLWAQYIWNARQRKLRK